MRKVILIPLVIVFAIILFIPVFNFFIFRCGQAPVRSVEKFTPSPLAKDEIINSEMNKLLNNDADMFFDFANDAATILLDKIGLVSDLPESASKNADVLNKAINGAKNGSVLVIPEGRYFIDRALCIIDKQNIVITSQCGQEVSLVNTAYSPFPEKADDSEASANLVNIIRCKNIKLENLSFDYQYNTSADGIITKHENGKTYFKVFPEFLYGEKMPLKGGEAIISVLSANNAVFAEERWVDSGVMPLEKTEYEDVFCIPMEIANAGDRICCRFSIGPYISYVIHAKDTRGLYLENLRCYSCPAGFILAPDGCSDFFFRNIKVEVKDGSNKLLGSNEDCIHLNNFSGRLVVKDCAFSGIGDDALNIHSQLATIEGITENYVTLASGREGMSLSETFAYAGETIEFFDENSNSLGFADIKKASRNKLEFEALSAEMLEARFAQNVSCYAETVIDNCNVNFGRARGFLIQTKNAVVRNCSFKNLRLSAILMSPDFSRWHEAGFVDNVIISHNNFENCSSLTENFGVIHASSSHESFNGNFKCKAGHKNITVENNTFSNCRSKAVVAYNVQNLKSANNIIQKGE